MRELGEKLRDKTRMKELQSNVWQKRLMFSFDYHIPNLVSYFRKIIAAAENKERASA